MIHVSIKWFKLPVCLLAGSDPQKQRAWMVSLARRSHWLRSLPRGWKRITDMLVKGWTLRFVSGGSALLLTAYDFPHLQPFPTIRFPMLQRPHQISSFAMDEEFDLADFIYADFLAELPQPSQAGSLPLTPEPHADISDLNIGAQDPKLSDAEQLSPFSAAIPERIEVTGGAVSLTDDSDRVAGYHSSLGSLYPTAGLQPLGQASVALHDASCDW